MIKMIVTAINNSTTLPSTGAPTNISRLLTELMVVGGCVGRLLVVAGVLSIVLVASVTLDEAGALITEVVFVEDVSVLLLRPLNTAVKLTAQALLGSRAWMVIVDVAPLDMIAVDPVGG